MYVHTYIVRLCVCVAFALIEKDRALASQLSLNYLLVENVTKIN